LNYVNDIVLYVKSQNNAYTGNSETNEVLAQQHVLQIHSIRLRSAADRKCFSLLWMMADVETSTKVEGQSSSGNRVSF
jgi:hypothetical protein